MHWLSDDPLHVKHVEWHSAQLGKKALNMFIMNNVMRYKHFIRTHL